MKTSTVTAGGGWNLLVSLLVRLDAAKIKEVNTSGMR